MKKLGKLQINSEKIMKNEELLTLRGGYGGDCCLYRCTSASQCCTDCPKCEEIPNWVDGYKYCLNP
jgi:hypothetical protein